MSLLISPCMRQPSSRAAIRVVALASPSPLMEPNWLYSMRESSVRLLPACCSTSLAMSTALLPGTPLRSRIASNSALLSSFLPFPSIFSRGLSSSAHSLSVR